MGNSIILRVKLWCIVTNSILPVENVGGITHLQSKKMCYNRILIIKWQNFCIYGIIIENLYVRFY